MYRFIDQHKQSYPVQLMCSVLKVSRSGYYAWRTRPVSPREQHRRRLLAGIREAHQASHEIYGYRRIHAQLCADGMACSRYLVARLMCEHHLRAQRVTRRPRTTTPTHYILPARNLLSRNFTAVQPNTTWLADITYIDTDKGFLYLAAVLDLYSRRIVGWAMDNHLRSQLVEQALDMALRRRQPLPGLLHRSDRGS